MRVAATSPLLSNWLASPLLPPLPRSHTHLFMVKFTADIQGPIVHWIQVTPDLGDRAGTRGVKQQSQKNVCRTGAGLFLSSQHVHRIVQEPDGVHRAQDHHPAKTALQNSVRMFACHWEAAVVQCEVYIKEAKCALKKWVAKGFTLLNWFQSVSCLSWVCSLFSGGQ